MKIIIKALLLCFILAGSLQTVSAGGNVSQDEQASIFQVVGESSFKVPNEFYYAEYPDNTLYTVILDDGREFVVKAIVYITPTTPLADLYANVKKGDALIQTTPSRFVNTRTSDLLEVIEIQGINFLMRKY